MVACDVGSSTFSNESSNRVRKKSANLTAFWFNLAVSGPAVDGGGIDPMGVLESRGLRSAGRCSSLGGSPGVFSELLPIVVEGCNGTADMLTAGCNCVLNIGVG